MQGEFDWEQQENLERVSSRIGAAIISFCVNRLRDKFSHEFSAEDLRQFVIRETGISAPASADRILRNLRQRGLVEYRVIDRRGSLYEVIAIKGAV